jgi:hypothetical protein
MRCVVVIRSVESPDRSPGNYPVHHENVIANGYVVRAQCGGFRETPLRRTKYTWRV